MLCNKEQLKPIRIYLNKLIIKEKRKRTNIQTLTSSRLKKSNFLRKTLFHKKPFHTIYPDPYSIPYLAHCYRNISFRLSLSSISGPKSWKDRRTARATSPVCNERDLREFFIFYTPAGDL